MAFVYSDPENLYAKVKGTINTIKSYFTGDKTVEYRTRALLCFLPKWEGFMVNEAAEQMTATEALVQLKHVVDCLYKVSIEEHGYFKQRQPSNFDARKVIVVIVYQRIIGIVLTIAESQGGKALL